MRKQKEVVKQLIERKRKNLQKVYTGLTCFKDGVRQIPIESIPGVVEAGFKSSDTLSVFQKSFTLLHIRERKHVRHNRACALAHKYTHAHRIVTLVMG